MTTEEQWIKPCALNLADLEAALCDVVAQILESNKKIIKCSSCGQYGHNKRSCSFKKPEVTSSEVAKEVLSDLFEKSLGLKGDEVSLDKVTQTKSDITSTSIPKPLLTEDLGKITEYAICLIYNTQFNGPFKYSVEKASDLSERLSALKTILPGKYIHTGNKDNLNDFQNEENPIEHLSVKSCKSGYKICPQLIGQTSRFAEHFEMPLSSTKEDIQNYIISNITHVMNRYTETTFHCPVLFYNEKKDEALLIRKINDLDWAEFTQKLSFTHIEKQKDWDESTTLKYEGKTIGEFQLHNHRNCTKFRFDIKNLLASFQSHFEVTNI